MKTEHWPCYQQNQVPMVVYWVLSACFSTLTMLHTIATIQCKAMSDPFAKCILSWCRRLVCSQTHQPTSGGCKALSSSTPLPAEAMVDGTALRVIRRRETVEDLLAHER